MTPTLMVEWLQTFIWYTDDLQPVLSLVANLVPPNSVYTRHQHYDFSLWTGENLTIK